MISYDARIEKAVRSVCLMQIITFAVLLLSGCSNVQSTVEDSNKEEIDSETVMDAASETIFETPQIPEKHIKTITSYKNGTTSGTPSYFVELDQNGNPLVYYNYNDDGTVNWEDSLTYEYNAAGEMISKIYYIEDGSIVTKKEWEYDSEGNMTAERYLQKNYQYEKTYEYDSTGKLIASAQNSNYSKGSTRYEYDASGNMTARYFYNGDGTIDWRGSNTMEYDSNGNKISEYYYDENGTVSDYFKREYDICGNCISNHHYYGDGSIISVENCVITYYD